ncbi:MAG: hypothetical protein K6T54_07255 [Ignavibacterium sp.]|nr:hypothetical protein [Ignavibacterium sp.]
MFSLCWLADKKYKLKPRFILDASRESLLVYWLHLITIYGMFWGGKSLALIIGNNLNLIDSLIVTLILISLMIIIAKLWGWMKMNFPKYTSIGLKVLVTILLITFVFIK